MNEYISDLFLTLPLIVLTLTSLILLVIESLLKKADDVTYYVSLSGLLLTLYLSFSSFHLNYTAYNSMIMVGGFSSYLASIFLLAAFFTIFFSRQYLLSNKLPKGEFYLLVLFATIGMILMASAADLIMVFIGLEIMSVCLYVLAGYSRSSIFSNEAALKYFLLGSFATAFLLYGIALIYGATGLTNIQAIKANLANYNDSAIFLSGMGLLLIGLAFKVGAVPFHMWIPDVYQGSPTPVAGFMATGAKAAAFSVLLLFFMQPVTDEIRTVLVILSALSMIAGNLIAIAQSNIKRMLAYSSIAHAGYMLIGLASMNQLGRDGVLFYLLSYMLMNIGAFSIVSFIEAEGGKNLSIDQYNGLGSKRPALAAMLSALMFSLSGIPPFSGFFGKYYIFIAAVNSNLTWLAILGVLTSLVAVYYYLRVVVNIYFREDAEITPGDLSFSSYFMLAIILALVTGIGLYPSSVLNILNQIP